MKIAIYPGTFDPITKGHIDILLKARDIFDKVYLAVAEVTGKNTLFTGKEREDLCKKATANIKNVTVERFDGLSVAFAKKHNAIAMIRGLRAVSDFEYELQIALMNKKLDSTINTIFLTPEAKHLYLSSSIMRQIVDLGAEPKDFLPKCVIKALKKKLNK